MYMNMMRWMFKVKKCPGTLQEDTLVLVILLGKVPDGTPEKCTWWYFFGKVPNSTPEKGT